MTPAVILFTQGTGSDFLIMKARHTVSFMIMKSRYWNNKPARFTWKMKRPAESVWRGFNKGCSYRKQSCGEWECCFSSRFLWWSSSVRRKWPGSWSSTVCTSLNSRLRTILKASGTDWSSTHSEWQTRLMGNGLILTSDSNQEYCSNEAKC